ncbi:MAG: hypothetical protein HGA37_01225 [Lentimicrobium sp.]|nr:hypothetical protein [Lentimicrobium sp.]
MDTFKTIEKAVVFSDAQYGNMPEQKITFVPLYFISAAVKNVREYRLSELSLLVIQN